MNQLNELHKKVTEEIIASRTQEVEKLRYARRDAAKMAEQRAQKGLKTLGEVGIDVAKLEAINRDRTLEGQQRYKALEAQMEELSQQPAAVTTLEVERAFVPEGVQVLSPSWVAAFSTQDDQDELAGASLIEAQDLLTGGGCKDYYNWASGGGWGCLGSGVGEIQSWIDFGFWFRPAVSKFYAVNPLFRFRGFYIVQADDGFWDCKSARVRVSAWTNVYQYNWKGWNHVDVLDVSDDNINVNNRFDTDRYTYNSYLLGGGDWAWIQCTIGLYARAQGGGSYAKNDFATGDANYLCVPQCYVY